MGIRRRLQGTKFVRVVESFATPRSRARAFDSTLMLATGWRVSCLFDHLRMNIFAHAAFSDGRENRVVRPAVSVDEQAREREGKTSDDDMVAFESMSKLRRFLGNVLLRFVESQVNECWTRLFRVLLSKYGVESVVVGRQITAAAEASKDTIDFLRS